MTKQEMTFPNSMNRQKCPGSEHRNCKKKLRRNNWLLKWSSDYDQLLVGYTKTFRVSLQVQRAWLKELSELTAVK